MDVIKSSRFWICALIVCSLTLMACLKIVTGTEALAYLGALLAGFGVVKATNGAPKVLIPLVLAASIALGGCG